MALLVFDTARKAFEDCLGRTTPNSVLLLTATLIAPGMDAAAMAASLIGYHLKAAATDNYIVENTNLRGLAIPAEQPDLVALYSASQTTPGLLNATRLQHPRYELTQAEYIKTILEAAAIVRDLMASSTMTRVPNVGVLDTVNPVPFMLGLPPPRGRQLWFDRAFPWPRAEQFIAGLDYVLVPKFPTDSASLREATRRYGDYLAEKFHRSESESWIVFRRNSADEFDRGRHEAAER